MAFITGVVVGNSSHIGFHSEEFPGIFTLFFFLQLSVAALNRLMFHSEFIKQKCGLVRWKMFAPFCMSFYVKQNWLGLLCVPYIGIFAIKYFVKLNEFVDICRRFMNNIQKLDYYHLK